VLREVVASLGMVNRTTPDVRLLMLDARRKLVTELKKRGLSALEWRTYVDKEGNAVLEVEARPV
jgi:hypothetical protein